MSEPELPVSAITESSDRLFVDIPWSPTGYLVEVAWIREHYESYFYAGIFTDTEFPEGIWDFRAMTIEDLDDALDECPIPGIDRRVLTSTVRQLLAGKR